MTTAQQIARIINDSTKQTGMTCAVVDNKAIAHVPYQSNLGNGYESLPVNSTAAAHRLVISMA